MLVSFTQSRVSWIIGLRKLNKTTLVKLLPISHRNILHRFFIWWHFCRAYVQALNIASVQETPPFLLYISQQCKSDITSDSRLLCCTLSWIRQTFRSSSHSNGTARTLILPIPKNDIISLGLFEQVLFVSLRNKNGYFFVRPVSRKTYPLSGPSYRIIQWLPNIIIIYPLRLQAIVKILGIFSVPQECYGEVTPCVK